MIDRIQRHPYYKIMTDLVPTKYTVLDLGCGNGLPMIGTNFKMLVGVDAFDKIHKGLFDMPEFDLILNLDIKNITDSFQMDSFDAITCIDVIEHLKKKDGEKLIKDMEYIARKRVLIFTPLIWSENQDSFKNPIWWSYGNTYNLHHSLWTEEDFTSKGYKIIKCQEGYVLAVKEI